MERINFAVQASSISWSGSKDICMNLVGAQPAVFFTIKKIFSSGQNISVVIIAPAFDKTGKLNYLIKKINDKRLSIYFGHSTSPLDRMLAAFKQLADSDYIIRIDGLNFGFDEKIATQMLHYAKKNKLDCLKFPDDFPVNLTCDIYRIGALKKLKKILNKKDDLFKIHPKYFMFLHKDKFLARIYKNYKTLSNRQLRILRKQYKIVFNAREGSVGERISTGDQLNYHYEIATQFVSKNMNVLDIACGEGYGTIVLAKKAKQAIGADIDRKSIQIARKLHSKKNLKFCFQDVTQTKFKDNNFDLITSMETIEHIGDDRKYMLEMKRILKKGGYFIFSTPQNSLGHIPMNNQHIREYSLKQIKILTQRYFKIERIVGIKQGKIVFPNDPIGSNTVLICRK